VNRWVNITWAQLAAAIALYRAEETLETCCKALGLAGDRRDRSSLEAKLVAIGAARSRAAKHRLIGRRWRSTPGYEGGTPAANRRKSKKWRLKAIVDGLCGTCGKPRERLKQRCDACQRVNNITTMVRRYAKAGVVLSRMQAMALLRPKQGRWPRSKFKQAVSRVAFVEVDRPAAIARAFADVGAGTYSTPRADLRRRLASIGE
jgi:hypothetical protein